MCDPSHTIIVLQLSEAQCDLISRKAIRKLQRIDASQGELANAWDEICVQVKEGESIFWGLYEDVALAFVQDQVGTLEEYIKHAIWLQTTPGEDWYFEDEEHREPAAVLDSDISQYILEKHIYQKAGDWTNRRIIAYLDLW